MSRLRAPRPLVRLAALALAAPLVVTSFAACDGASDLGAPTSRTGAEDEPGTLPDETGGGGSSGGSGDAGGAPVDPGDASPPADAGGDASTKDPDLGNSAGCGNAGAGTGLQTRTMDVGGATRRYLRFIPNGYRPNVPLALVFALHGSGGTAERARAMVDMEGEAAGKAIFIYPQGRDYDPNFPGDNRWDPTKNSVDYTFFDALRSEVEKSHCIDRDKVFVTGFSNGARMTAMLGCYRGDVLRAIAPVAPGGNATTLPLAAGACVGEVGLWSGVGTEDAEHIPGQARVRDWYRAANGCATTKKAVAPNGCMAFDGCRAEVPVTDCSYPGGHVWPPLGTRGVWGFFARFD